MEKKCKNQIKIKSIRFFGGRSGSFCLIQKSKHPILLSVNCDECKNCTKCEYISGNVPEYDEAESDNKFGIWDFYGPEEHFKYQKNNCCKV